MKRRDIDTYFTEVKTKLENKLKRASDVLTEIEQKLNETESNRQQSADVFKSLNENFTSALALINETKDDLAKVTELRTLALDPDSGIESLLTKITSTSEQAEKLVAKISTYNQEALANGEIVNRNAKSSSTYLAEIEKLDEKAKELLVDLEKTYQLAINTGLAGSFDERKKKIQDEFVNSWSKRFTFSVIILGVAATVIAGVTWFIADFTLEWLTIFRLSLLSPLIFYTGYATIQYGKERRLLEKYAFKAAIAKSLESYTQILSTNFDKKRNEEVILQFVLDSMKSIYSEPYEEVKKRSYGFSIGNKIAEIKSEMIEEVTQIVEKKLEKNIDPKV